MGLLTIMILVFLIGIALIFIPSKDGYDLSNSFFIGLFLVILSVIILIFIIILCLFKPIDAKRFKISYDTVKQVDTSSVDIRDTNYTMKIIEINTEINRNKAFINNEWIGILYNRQIAELELLGKDKE